MLTVDQAKQQLYQQSHCLAKTVHIDIAGACGSVLAEDVYAAMSVPPFDNSAMDGFALRINDIKANNRLPISQRLLAGMAAQELQPGSAARLFTGSMVPPGADTVVAQENCDYDRYTVLLSGDNRAGQNIRRAGEDIAKGSLLASSGLRLKPAHIGLLASCGVDNVRVYQPLKIGLLATGSELQMPGQPLPPGKIYNSNLPMLAALLERWGYQLQCRHVSDDAGQLQSVFEALAGSNDVLVSIGGVSVGDADLVRGVIEQNGHLDLWKIAMKPGKPLAVGRIFQRPVIGLPGNPVSAFVSLQLFAREMLARMQGEKPVQQEPCYYPLMLDAAITPKREEFLRVKLESVGGQPRLFPFPHQGSGVLSSVVYASGLARLSMNRETAPGDFVQYTAFA